VLSTSLFIFLNEGQLRRYLGGGFSQEYIHSMGKYLGGPGNSPGVGFMKRLVLRAVNLYKSYRMGKNVVVPALRGANVEIYEGDFVAIIGPSGSGKTTLLNILGLLDTPDSGELYIEETPVVGLDDDDLSEIRLRKIGFVFQHYNLIRSGQP
jgi:ABC-type multidrug transport system fused ATPase/permease subunit